MISTLQPLTADLKYINNNNNGKLIFFEVGRCLPIVIIVTRNVGNFELKYDHLHLAMYLFMKHTCTPKRAQLNDNLDI